MITMTTELKQPASTLDESFLPDEFVCDCDWIFRTACQGLSFYKEYQGKRYCVLHYPGKEKSADFIVALRKKLEAKDFTFHGVRFLDSISFAGVEFGAGAFFRNAKFSADVDFNRAKFEYAREES